MQRAILTAAEGCGILAGAAIVLGLPIAFFGTTGAIVTAAALSAACVIIDRRRAVIRRKAARR